MKQQFMRGGKWMTLEKAKEYDASQLVPEAKPPVVKPDVIVETIDDLREEEEAEERIEAEEVVAEKATTGSELGDLKAECDAKGIKYHHASGIKKLQELLNNHVIN